ncbi:MAG: hypothetical protein JST92_22660 [Deltaproteobacteria bacterium]|nr:hypothetical protein [Deltaproteobacteria bacterium]
MGTKKYIVKGEPFYQPGKGLQPPGTVVELEDTVQVSRRWVEVKDTPPAPDAPNETDAAQPVKRSKRPSDSSPA